MKDSKANNRNFLKSIIFTILLISFLITPLILTADYSGTNESVIETNGNGVYRVGCGCCDRTQSQATGRGACSWHGGVKYWIYYDNMTGAYYYESTGRCD